MALLVDHLALGPQGNSHIPRVLGHQGNTLDLLQHLAGSPLVLEYLDNSHLHQELQGSFPPALEPLGRTPGSSPEPPGSSPEPLGSIQGSSLGSSLGSTLLKELQDNYLEAPVLTQLDHFLLAPELPLVLIQMCLTQEVSQEEATGCTDLVVQVHSLLLALVRSLHTLLLEASPQFPLGHGDHLQGGASLQPLDPLVQALGLWVQALDLWVLGLWVQALGLWVRTVGRPLREA